MQWRNRPKITRDIPLDCECGQEALVPIDGSKAVLSVKGMSVVLDTNSSWEKNTMPGKLQCRKCGKIYER